MVLPPTAPSRIGRTALRRLAVAALLTGMVFWPQSAKTQSTVPVETLTGPIRAELVRSIAAGLAEGYVDPAVGRTIGDSVTAKLQAGAYDSLTNPAQFADTITRDLRTTNGDLHLSLRYSPTPPAPNRPAGDPFADASRQNFGLGRAEILEGNIGYLEITGFIGSKGYQEVVVDVLRFLSRTDALIIDLRRNGGGSGEMTHFVFSHFFGETPVQTIRVRSRRDPEGTVRTSLASVPGPRRPDLPLYILTSQRTGSAAEEFSFVLRNRKRATLIGSRTAGAGHMVAFRPMGHGFTLGVSITHVSDPETGQEWEQVGVQPHVAVPAERALLEAHAAALRTVLGSTTSADRKALLSRLLAAADARRQPVPLDASRLARLAGTYGGRIVSVIEGRLHYARGTGALHEPLTALGGDRFALGAVQFLFEERGGTRHVTIEQPDGTRATFPKDAGTGR